MVGKGGGNSISPQWQRPKGLYRVNYCMARVNFSGLTAHFFFVNTHDETYRTKENRVNELVFVI